MIPAGVFLYRPQLQAETEVVAVELAVAVEAVESDAEESDDDVPPIPGGGPPGKPLIPFAPPGPPDGGPLELLSVPICMRAS